MLFSFRLGLVFFDGAEYTAVRRHLANLQSEGLPWQVVDGSPYDALLLARGPRLADPDHLALLRLSADLDADGAVMAPIALRKPLSPGLLRPALESVATRLGRRF